MNIKTLIPIISMVSVLVMFIWSNIEGGYSHSWLAAFAGGIVITILTMIERGKKGEKDKDEK